VLALAAHAEQTGAGGLGLTKMARFGKTPVKFIVEVNYSAIRPDDYGTEWKFIFRIAPVIQSPFH
jgi:hypothetical protein